MNILMTLSNPFTHDPRVYNEAKSLLNAGHTVTVFAWDRHHKSKKIETKDGIKIVRSYNNKIMDLLPYDIFKLYFWWKKAYHEVSELHDKNHFDVIHCHNLDTLPIALKLKKKFDFPVIYDAHEIWGYMVGLDFPNPIVHFFLYLEKRMIRHIDYIITVNDLLKEYFEKLSHKPVNIIMNAKRKKYEQYQPPSNDKFTVVYQGTLDSSRNLEELIKSVSDLKDVQCIIGGIGHDKSYVDRIMKSCKESENCTFLGKIPMDKVIPNTRKADLVYLVVSTKAPKIKWPVDVDFPPRFGLANKFFEALTAGRPILASTNTYNGIIVDKLGCGILTECNVKDIKNKIGYLKENKNLCEKMGRAAFEAGKKWYNWEYQEKKLLEVYTSIQ